MKPGRNESCPCGSGKKYKHCCLVPIPVAADVPVDLVWRRLRVLLDGYATELVRFTTQTYGPAALHEAWDAFTCFNDIAFDPETPFMQAFMPWFFHRWAPDPEDTVVADKALYDVSPTQAYLAKKGRRLDPLLRRYFESCLSAPFTYLEVKACEPGRGFRLRDIMTGEEHDVTERSLSTQMKRGDIFFGQLVFIDRLTMIEACSGFPIPVLEKARIVELRARIASANPVITKEVLRDYDFELLEVFNAIADRAFNPQLPKLQNTDGEPLSPHKLVFELDTPPQTAFDALKHLALDEPEEALLAEATRNVDGNLTHVRFSWKKRGNKVHAEWENTVLGSIEIDGTRLTAEVNSEARAAAAREEIEAALGARVRYRATEIQSMERMLAEAKEARSATGSAASEEHNRLAALPEVRAQLAEMMAAHWERWVDQPIPMLGNRTPMDAVKDPDGREVVESLVIEGERLGLNMNPPTDEVVFRRVRERLGLAEPG
jgi:hypothetical protein